MLILALDLNVDAIFSDEEMDVLGLSAQLVGGDPLPAWLSFSLTSPGVYTFSGTPGNADVGTLNIEVTADDGNGGNVSDTMTITVINVNDAPIAEPTTIAAYEKHYRTVTMNTSDIDPTGDSISCRVETLPHGGNIFFTTDGSTVGTRILLTDLPAEVTNCQVIYNTQANFSGDVTGYDSFQFSAFDGQLRSTTNGTVTIDILNTNNSPTDIVLSSTSIEENNSINQLVGIFSAVDFDASDSHTFTLVSGEGGLHNDQFSINTAGELRASVVFNHEAEQTKQIRVRVTDSEGAAYVETFVIQIVDVNEIVESVTLSNDTIVENQDANQKVGYLDISDPDEGDSWQITITHIDGNPASSFSPVPFVIIWEDGTPFIAANTIFNNTAKSQYVLSLDITDNGGLTYSTAFTVYVQRQGEAMVTDDTGEGQVGDSITLDLLANDNFSEVEQLRNGENAGWRFSRLIVPPLYGVVQTVSGTDGTVIYTPNDGFEGTDLFVYMACDNSDYCDYGTVHITISSPDEDLPENIPPSGFAPKNSYPACAAAR